MRENTIDTPRGLPWLWRWYSSRLLRTQVVLLMVPFLLGIVVLMWLALSQSFDHSRKLVIDNLNEEANDLKVDVAQPFASLIDDLLFIESETAVLDYAESYNAQLLTDASAGPRQAQINRALERVPEDIKLFLQGNSFYAGVRLVDPDGVALVHVARRQGEIQLVEELQSLEADEGFEMAVDELVLPTQIWVSDVQPDPLTGQPYLQVITPVSDSLTSTQVAGYLVFDLDLTTALRSIVEHDIVNGIAYLVDEEGFYLAHSDLDVSERGKQIESDLATTILVGNSMREIELSYDGDNYIGATAIVRPFQRFQGVTDLPEWTVVIGQPESSVLGSVRWLPLIVGGAFGFLLLVAGALFWVQSGWIGRQIDNLRRGLERIRRGDLTVHIRRENEGQLGVVAEAFNLTAGHLRSLVADLENRVQARIRDLELVAEISREIVGLSDLDLVLNRAIERIVDRFDYYHAQVFLIDDVRENARLVASTGTAGRQLINVGHKLAVGSDSVIGRVTALGVTVIAGDTQRSDVPWHPNPFLPDTRSEMALPLKVEDRVIGALDIQSLRPEAYSPSDIEIFQVLADQLAIAINNARLITQLQTRIDEVNRLNQRLAEKGWTDFTGRSPADEPMAYRYNLLDVEPVITMPRNGDNDEPGYGVGIEIAGNTIGRIQTDLRSAATGEEKALIDAVAARVALAVDNARLVQETEQALSEAQRLFEMARIVNQARELGLDKAYDMIIRQMSFERALDRVAILLTDNVPTLVSAHLIVAYVWSRDDTAVGWRVAQQLNLLQQGLAMPFETEPSEPIIVSRRDDIDNSALAQIAEVLQLETMVLVPLVSGARWAGVLICGSRQTQAFGESFINFSRVVGDQLTIAIENNRLFAEVQDEARRALALAEAGQLISQLGGDFDVGVGRLFRIVSGPGEFDRWWVGLLSPDGKVIRQIAGSSPDRSLPDRIELDTSHNGLTEAIHLQQMILVNEFDEPHPVLGEISSLDRRLYGKHLTVPVMIGGGNALGVILIGRNLGQPDFDERDMQLASSLASQLAVATENQRLFGQMGAQQQTLQSTLEAMPAGVLVLTPDGSVEVSNRQASDLLGVGIKDGLFAEDTYPLYSIATEEPVDRKAFPAILHASGDRFATSEGVYVMLPGGYRLDLLVNAAPIRDGHGEIQSLILVFQEITELRELERALQASLSETTALYEASRAIAAATTANELVLVLVEQLLAMMPDGIFALFREGQDQGHPETKVVGSWPDEGVDPPLPIELLSQQDGLVLDDIETLKPDDPNAVIKEKAQEAGVRSLATLPLRARGGRTLGWLVIIYHDRREFSSDERRFLTTLADQAAIALDVIRLFESTQSALRSVANLYRGSKRIAEAHGIVDAVEVMREELMNFHPDRIDLLLQQSAEDPDSLTHALAWNSERSLQDVPSLPINPDTLLPQTEFDLLSREEYYVQHIDDPIDDNVLTQSLRALDSPYQSVLTVPLRVGGRTVGRLSMAFLEPRTFTPDDRQFVTMLADSTAYTVENELLFQQTQDSLEETGVLYQASRAIANAELREDVVQAMIDYAASAVVDKVMLITLLTSSWEDAEAVIEVSASWGRGEFLDLKGLRFSRGQLPIWDQLSASEIIWSNDVENDHELDEATLLGCRTLDIASFVVVPLQTASRAIGAIMLASSEPRVHQDREIRIYQSLADQAAVQLENKRLYEQADRRARQLAISAEVSRAATQILNLDELFPRIVHLIRESFGYDHAQIFMIDDDGVNAVLQAATGEAGRQMLAIRHSLPVGSQSVVGQATSTGKSFLVNDTLEAGAMHRPNPYLPETRAELAIPLIVKGAIVGAIDVQSNQPGTFTVDDIQALESLSAQLAIAIDNAQLFDISQKRASDMSFLFDVTAAAAAPTSLVETLETVSTVLVRQMNGQETAIFLYSPLTDMLESQVIVVREMVNGGVEYRFVEDANISIGLGEGIIGSVAETREPLIVIDFEDDNRYVMGLQQNRSGIYVPLTVGDELIGVLGIEGAEPGQYGEADLRLLQTSSRSLTAIIQNTRLVEELRITNERLREIDQLKTNFLAAMSHELRTPLNSIIGFSRVILKGIDGPVTEMQRQDIQTIHDSGKHLLGLVNDILDQAKVEAGKMELVKEHFDLVAVVKGVMSSAVGFTKDKPVQLFTEIEDDLPQAFGDEFRTRQILFNLVSNAAKFTNEGSVTVSVYATPDERTDHPMITISVSDTGIGIAEEHMTRIFESFQQVDNTTTRSAEGTGLGLPLAKSLSELQGGTIWVESGLGVGSTFYATIPTDPEQVISEDEAEEDEMPEFATDVLAESDVAPTSDRKVILAVDDELGIINLYRRYLSKEGWQVIGTTKPEQTEEMVATHHPHIILLDINMPSRDGWDILLKLKEREDSSEIPVIVCSIDNDTDRSTRMGAARHLVKPFVESDLLKAVEEVETL